MKTLLLALTLVSSFAHAADLKVSVWNLRNQKGVVQVAIYSKDQAATFPKADPSVRTEKVPIAQAGAFIIADLKPGRYAIAMFHDENNNGKLDTIFGKIPKEGFGFSNNSQKLGAPSFDEAAIEVPAQGAAIKIKTRYLF